jgi:hypothetical protein
VNSRGNASIVVLIIFFAVSAVFLSAAAFSGGLIKLSYGIKSEYDEKAFLAAEAEKIMALMARDPTPEADSSLDPVWAEVALPSTPGIELKLEDISSRINPNAAIDLLLKGMNLFKPDKLFEQFQKFRLENGPLNDVRKGYADFIKEEALDEYCTEFTFFNVNTAEEEMLYRLFEQRTGKKATASAFPALLRLKKENKVLVTAQNIKEVLGVDFDSVYPFISAEPELNVNLVDKAILTTLFAIAKNTYKMELNGDVAAAILNMRAQTEITPSQLPALIQPKFKNTVLEAYVGCRTWFWRLTVTKGEARYQCVVARLPASPGEKEKGPRFRLVEERFTRPPSRTDIEVSAESHE